MFTPDGGDDAVHATMPGPAPAAPLAWSDAFVLGHGPIDDTHREFVDCVRAIQTAGDADLLAALHALEAHARRHFGDEDRWMRETDFPPRDCHIDEHGAVLRSIEQVRALAEAGDPSEIRRLAQALADWFPGHADWLDSALAHWLCKRALGGKPVVLRRDLRATLEAGREAAPEPDRTDRG
jgi:hemerythrin-like metal-binding protein